MFPLSSAWGAPSLGEQLPHPVSDPGETCFPFRPPSRVNTLDGPFSQNTLINTGHWLWKPTQRIYHNEQTLLNAFLLLATSSEKSSNKRTLCAQTISRLVFYDTQDI